MSVRAWWLWHWQRRQRSNDEATSNEQQQVRSLVVACSLALALSLVAVQSRPALERSWIPANNDQWYALLWCVCVCVLCVRVHACTRTCLALTSAERARSVWLRGHLHLRAAVDLQLRLPTPRTAHQTVALCREDWILGRLPQRYVEMWCEVFALARLRESALVTRGIARSLDAGVWRCGVGVASIIGTRLHWLVALMCVFMTGYLLLR